MKTIELDDRLFAEAQDFAAQSGQTVSSVVEEALRAILPSRKEKAKKEHIRLITDTGNGLQPGVDLDNTGALLDLMEGIDAPN